MRREMLCLQCTYFQEHRCLCWWSLLWSFTNRVDFYWTFLWLDCHHFAKRVSVRPIVLLVDGHSSHMDLHTSTFCKQNKILLYCLPPHSSHLTQPLDVSFFKPLKSAWGKACSSYCATNPGFQVTKHELAQVFRDAWVSSTRMSTIVSGFREAGLCPLNPKVILKNKWYRLYSFPQEMRELRLLRFSQIQWQSLKA